MQLGKSRLVAELRRQRDTAGLSWYEGRCLSYEASTPYLPFIGLLGNILDSHTEGTEGTEGTEANRYEWVKSRIAGRFPEGSQEIAPFIAMLMGVPPAGEDYEVIRYLEPPLLRG